MSPCTMALSLWLEWKVTTLRALIGTDSPVRGLRPGREPFSRIVKLPKPDSLTSVPLTSASCSRSKKASTMSLDSRLFRPMRSNSSSASSAFVSVGVSSEGRITGSGRVGSVISPGGRFSRVGSSMSVIIADASGAQAGTDGGGGAGYGGGDGGVDDLVGQRRVVGQQLQPHGQAALARRE